MDALKSERDERRGREEKQQQKKNSLLSYNLKLFM